jgi:hypothetical protein
LPLDFSYGSKSAVSSARPPCPLLLPSLPNLCIAAVYGETGEELTRTTMAGRRHGKSSRGRPGHHRAQIFRDRRYPVERKISNLTLLEGAFSHNALSSDGPINGAFRSVIDNAKVAGRIAAAQSDHGTAVWIFYPPASRIFRDSYSLRLAGQRGQAFGGPTDRYGAIGANGPHNRCEPTAASGQQPKSQQWSSRR